MKRHHRLVLISCVLGWFSQSMFLSSPAAQTPRIQTYFDEALTSTTGDCIESTLADVFVAIQDFPSTITRLEYSLSYPGSMVWVLDTGLSGSVEGNTVSGVIHSWPTPQNASAPLIVMRATIMWIDCSCTNIDPLCLRPHPTDNRFGALSSAGQWIFAEGWGSQICPILGGPGPVLCEALPVVPVNADTWGAIKELYK